MITKAQELGQVSEDRAAEYLLSLGWRILDRNVKNKYGELDIVALDDDYELVIVEVRARTLGKMQDPLESIGPRKLRALLRASIEYVDGLEWVKFWRIDVVGITMNNRKAPGDWELEHVRDITAGMEL